MALLVQLVLVLGVLWARVHAALHPTDPSAAPEAECVASYLSSVLPPDKSCLVVHGDAQLVGPLLQELGEGRQTIVKDPRDLPDRLRCELHDTPKLAVIGMVSANWLSEVLAHTGAMAPMSGIVLWTRAPSLLDALHHLKKARGTVYLCMIKLDLVVSAPNGTSFLGQLTANECVPHFQSLKVQAIDRCTSGPGWQHRQWHKLCSEWQPPKEGPRLRVYSFKPKETAADSVIDGRIVGHITAALNRRHPFNVSLYEKFDEKIPRVLESCGVALCFTRIAVPVIDVPHIRFAGLRIRPTIAIVPAGAGLRLLPLRAVTAEFSAELWVATALALLFMTAALAVAWTTLGRPPLPALAAASLQTLAPLLAQSQPGRTAHLPLSAVWLLTSVVLVAAYQGLLLRELTSPPPEINSLEQLEQSGLDIYADSSSQVLHHIRSTISWLKKENYLRKREIPDALQNVADRRNSTVLCFADAYCNYVASEASSGPWRRLHSFTVPGSHYLTGEVVYSSKSPLGGPLKGVIAAARCGGLNRYREDAIYQSMRRRRRGAAANVTVDLGRTQPLSMGHMMPAFCLLLVGLTLGVLVFALEVLSDAWSRRHAPPVAVFLQVLSFSLMHEVNHLV
ncbi:Ionotropic receptor 120 [Frankliniella occidentalis]|nr:Ionotropic receptor 120 [Frankliniella occidentalis]